MAKLVMASHCRPSTSRRRRQARTAGWRGAYGWGASSLRPASATWLSSLLDHLVGEGEQLGRHVKTQCIRSPQIDEELELGRLKNRQSGGRLSFQNTSHVHTNSPISIRKVVSVAR